MNNLIASSLLLSCVFFYSCSDKTDSISTTEKEIQESISMIITKDDTLNLRYLKEVEWPKAYSEQDTILLDRILHNDFKMIDASGGWYDKKDELDWIKEHAMEHDSFRYEIKRLDIFSNGTAVVAGTGHIINDSTHSTYESSNVLIKNKGKWRAILSHVSGIKENQ